MTASRRTDQTQWPGAARAAHDVNLTTSDYTAANQAITLLVQRTPLAELIKALQDRELIRAGELDGKQQCHAIQNDKLLATTAISRTAIRSIGKNLICLLYKRLGRKNASPDVKNFTSSRAQLRVVQG